MDFDDLLCRTVGCSTRCPRSATNWQARFRYVLVDEYQDTNHAQYLLVQLLAARHRNLCVVGDADQSIYSWRGADIRNILDFERDYPDAARRSRSSRTTARRSASSTPPTPSSPTTRERKEKRALDRERRGRAGRGSWSADDEQTEAEFVVAQIERRSRRGPRLRRRRLLPHERAVARARGRARRRRRRRTRSSAARILRSQGGQGRPRLPAAAGQPGGRDLARRIINAPAARHRRHHRVAVDPARRGVGMTLRDALREAEIRRCQSGRPQRPRSTAFSSCSTACAARCAEKGVGRSAGACARRRPATATRSREERTIESRGRPRTSTNWSAWRASSTPATMSRRSRRSWQELALVVRRRRGDEHTAGAGHADDAAHREGPRVPGRVPGRDGGRRVPAPACDRRSEPGGGAAALLRRHDAGPRAA